MKAEADADYFAARAAKHGEMAERTTSLEAQQAHRELSETYATRAATLIGDDPQAHAADLQSGAMIRL